MTEKTLTTLFEWGEARARTTDPETSHDAADSIRGENATRVEKIIIEALSKSPDGLTCFEIVANTGLYYATCTPRIKPLRRKGLVIDSGTRRESPFGKMCIVWKLSV